MYSCLTNCHSGYDHTIVILSVFKNIFVSFIAVTSRSCHPRKNIYNFGRKSIVSATIFSVVCNSVCNYFFNSVCNYFFNSVCNYFSVVHSVCNYFFQQFFPIQKCSKTSPFVHSTSFYIYPFILWLIKMFLRKKVYFFLRA